MVPHLEIPHPVLELWKDGSLMALPSMRGLRKCATRGPLCGLLPNFWERAYEIKDNNLEGKYKDWQKKLHPDLVHLKSEKERAFAAEQSARVIDAYRTLSKPLSMALYLLQLEGVHVDEEKTLTDPEILVEMMEIREAVEEAADSNTLKQIQPQIQNKLDKCSSSFREAFEERNFKDAITSVQRMRYYDRAIEAIVKKL